MYEKANEVLRAIAHPVRIKIIKKLYKNPACVCNLNEDINYSQANLSKHLRILKNANIVECKKEGMYRYYKLTDEKIIKIIKLAEEIASK